MNTTIIVAAGVAISLIVGYGHKRIVAIPAYAVLAWCATFSVLI